MFSEHNNAAPENTDDCQGTTTLVLPFHANELTTFAVSEFRVTFPASAGMQKPCLFVLIGSLINICIFRFEFRRQFKALGCLASTF